jgi:hypothetical protein
MSDYAHVPGGSLKFKGTGEKYVPLEETLIKSLTVQEEKEEVAFILGPRQSRFRRSAIREEGQGKGKRR